MEETGDESAFRVTMADGLRPLLKVNYLLGVSTYTISSTGHLQYPRRILSLVRVIITLILITSSASYTFYRMLHTLVWNELYRSPGIARFNKMVELICQFVSNISPLTLILLCLFKTKATRNFFDEMGRYNAGIHRFAEPTRVRTISRRCFIMHLLMITASVLLLLLRVFTALDPTEIMMRGRIIEGSSVAVANVVNCLALTLLVFCKQSSVAFIEVFSVALATCFDIVIRNLTTFILNEAENWETVYLDSDQDILSPSNISQKNVKFHFENIIQSSQYTQNSSSPQENKLQPKMKRTKENEKKKNIDPLIQHSLQGMTPGQKICYTIRKMQCVATMQTAVNDLFGLILALDVGFTVFMLVVLKYLLIRNMDVHIARLRQIYMVDEDTTGEHGLSLLNTSTIIKSTNKNYSISEFGQVVDGSYGSDLFVSSPYGWLFFLGFDLCFSLRLIIVIYFLSKVYNASSKFNAALSKALLCAQKLADLLDETRRKYGRYEKADFLENIRVRRVFVPLPLTTVTQWIL
ncbi:unnamed protein product [Orchesella dallaii]|uniref:Gustatory receptor n=1 Tax=Orchesella dallaii TaxID=48710 RepID=A0ABP1RFF2_9HEXA